MNINIEGKDIVALTAIVVNGLLIYCGQDGAIISIMSTIIGWYFGTKTLEGKPRSE